MTEMRWLVVTGGALNVIGAIIAFATGNRAAGWVLLLVAAAWLTWVFTRDRG